MNFRCAMIFAIAAFVIPIPTIIRAQEEPDEIQESGPRLGEEEARRILAEALPPSATNQQQIAYFQRRERAAFTMGEAMVRIDALRRLVELTATPDKPSPYISYLWRELWRYGNQTEALEMGDTLVRHRGITPEQRIAWTVNLGRDYANLGNRSRAAELLKQAEAEVKTTQATGNLHMLAYTTIATEDLRATVLQGQNDPDGALVAMRRALDASLAEVKRSRSVVGSPRTDLEYDAAIRQRNGVMGTLA
jgi:tetratricopeptide (TPR) repeat protein